MNTSNTTESRATPATPATPTFAVWLTGLPASGKSTIAKALLVELRERGLDPVHLESDALRRELTPHPTYTQKERDLFYRAMSTLGRILIERRIPVIFDATANRRAYRDRARQSIPRFLEIYIDTPLPVCQTRDPKGIYRAAVDKPAGAVPGLQAPYEPPEHQELTLHTDRHTPQESAAKIIAELQDRGWLGNAGG